MLETPHFFSSVQGAFAGHKISLWERTTHGASTDQPGYTGAYPSEQRSWQIHPSIHTQPRSLPSTLLGRETKKWDEMLVGSVLSFGPMLVTSILGSPAWNVTVLCVPEGLSSGPLWLPPAYKLQSVRGTLRVSMQTVICGKIRMENPGQIDFVNLDQSLMPGSSLSAYFKQYNLGKGFWVAIISVPEVH